MSNNGLSNGEIMTGDQKNYGLEYVVIEEYKHPMVVDSAKPDLSGIHNYRSLDKAMEVLSKFPITEGDGTWNWQTRAYLTERVNPAEPQGKDGTYFSICHSFRAENTAVRKHNTYSAAEKAVSGWNKKNPLGETYIARLLRSSK